MMESVNVETADAADVAHTMRAGRPRSAEADQAILEATLELLAELGYGGFTMAAVIARSGVSSATLYRRYADKDDLILAALKGVKDSQWHQDTGSFESDLRSLLCTCGADMCGPAGRLMTSLIGDLMRHPEFGTLVRDRLIESGRDDLRQIFERAVARGEISKVPDAELAGELIIGPMLHHLLLGGDSPSPEYADRLLPYLLAAFRD
jgi:AcrR family transcriptional regulator